MAGTSLADTLKEYQVRLLSSLPMDDPIFVAMLDKSSFFVGNHKATMQSKETKVDKASYFLDYIIERHIDAYFVRLLNVMEVYGGDEQSLAREIKGKLGISKHAHFIHGAGLCISLYTISVYVYVFYSISAIPLGSVRRLKPVNTGSHKHVMETCLKSHDHAANKINAGGLTHKLYGYLKTPFSCACNSVKTQPVARH